MLRNPETIRVLGAGAVVVLIAGGFLYWESRAQSGGKEQIIGSVTYRYRTAQRRSTSSVVWDDVDPGEVVRIRDSIRTDAQSEASIKLGDGTTIELDPDSMIVLNVGTDKPGIELIHGSAVMENSTGRAMPPLLNAGNAFSSEGRMRVSNIDDRVEAESTSSIHIKGRAGDRWIESGWAAIQSDRVDGRARTISPVQPADNARFFSESAEVPVSFSWNASASVVLDVSLDRSFRRIVLRKEIQSSQGGTESLGEGIYYWRVSSAGVSSEVRKFRVIRITRVGLVVPSEGQEFKGSAAVVHFQWKTSRLDATYRLEVAKDPNFATPVETRSVHRDSLSLSFAPGEYFWRLTTVGSVGGAGSVSETRTFKVTDPNGTVSVAEKQTGAKTEKTEGPRLPFPLIPAPGGSVDMAAQSALILRWSAVPGASSYHVRLTQLKTGAVILDKDTTGTEVSFTDLARLDEGEFSWKVEAVVGTGGENRVSGPEARFQITLSEKLERPELNIQ